MLCFPVIIMLEKSHEKSTGRYVNYGEEPGLAWSRALILNHVFKHSIRSCTIRLLFTAELLATIESTRVNKFVLD